MECYHGSVIDLPTVSMEDWEFNQGFYCALSQKAKEDIDALAGGTFFMLNAEKERALLENLSASKRESQDPARIPAFHPRIHPNNDAGKLSRLMVATHKYKGNL
jgi:plasmid stabilization system protein ParE